MECFQILSTPNGITGVKKKLQINKFIAMFSCIAILTGGSSFAASENILSQQQGIAMSQVTFQGKPFNVSGQFPKVGETAPPFSLTAADLSQTTLADFAGKKKVINIFVSIDTPVCAVSLRQFNEKLAQRDDVVVINVSADLPFAFSRFCAAEGLDNVKTLSTFRSMEFGEQYGVRLSGGALDGLLTRAVIVLDENNQVKYVQKVSEITHEPDYAAAIAAL